MNLTTIVNNLALAITVASMAALSFAASSARASQISEDFVVSGVLDVDTLKSLRLRLQQNQPIRQVKFLGCLGGDSATSMEIAGIIRDKGLNTFAQGQVNSACHLAFLGGVERRISSGTTTAMLVHAPNKNGKPLSEAPVALVMGAMSILTDGRFPGKYREQITSFYTTDTGLMFVSEPSADTAARQSLHICARNISEPRSTCNKVGDVSFRELGFITH